MKRSMPSRTAARHEANSNSAVRDAVSGAMAATFRQLGRDPFPTVVGTAGSAIQEPIATGRRVVVCSPERGTGASTVASLMGCAVSTFRHDLLALVDVGDGPSGLRPIGSSPFAPETALGALAVNEPATREEFRRTLRLDDSESVLNLQSDAPGAALSAPAVSALIAGCTRHCAVTITETPSGLEDERTLAALESAHTAVVVTPRASDASGSATRFIGLLRHVHPNLPIVEVLNERQRTKRSTRRQTPRGAFVLRHARRRPAGDASMFATLGEPMTMEVLTLTAHVLTRARKGRVAATAQGAPR